MTQNSAMEPQAGSEKSSLVSLLGRPFGTDEQGQPIDHGSGKLILGSIEWMQQCISRQVAEAAPSDLRPEDVAALAGQARAAAMDRLVDMLNAAIGDPRYRVSVPYLMNQRNLYSYEFRLFVADYCRELSGDAEFFRHAGEQSIGGPVSLLGRPLGLQRTYAVLPRFAAKFVKTDIRVVNTTPTSAIIQWHGKDQAELVPGAHRLAYIRYACESYQGGFGEIPRTVFGLPAAGVSELRCQAEGAECCEWQFTWVPGTASGSRRVLALGVVTSAALAGALAIGAPGMVALAALGIAAPTGLAWHAHRIRRVTGERNNFERQVLDERDLAEQEYDQSESANANLQRVNVELVQRLAELTALHESALALSSTLEVEEVLKASLQVIVDQLGYERALVMLANDESGVLEGRAAVGVTPEMQALIRQLQLRFDDTQSPLVTAFSSDGPTRFDDIHESPVQATRDFALALGARSFVAAPLITKGRRVGVLAVDNALTGRPLDSRSDTLLVTLGRQIGAAVESAQLHARVEAQNRTLEERVTARTAELELAKTDLERELTERLRLRERELEYLSQVNRVVAAAMAVENEAFDPSALRETAARGDELGQLARTFTRMATGMVARETRLLNQVRELRIEIDGARQAEQVADIVGTEYFQSLRSQARDLRKIVSNR